jgi:hypothetical protein
MNIIAVVYAAIMVIVISLAFAILLIFPKDERHVILL